jgi:hypothetical protein
MAMESLSTVNVPGELMRVALVILCVGAVTFLLRFLAALVTEGMKLPPKSVYRRRGEVIEMNPEQNKRVPARRGERKAI